MDARTVPIDPDRRREAPGHAAFEYLTTKKDELGRLGAQVLALSVPVRHRLLRAWSSWRSAPSPYDTDRFGAALPRFSPRQADLLMVVGTVTHKQAPILLKVYEQMCEPKWVMAFGACATSGGFYQNYADGAGHRHDHPGRRLRARLPAAARDGDRRDHAAAGSRIARDRAIRSSTRTF